MKTSRITFIFMLLAAGAQAQDYAFKVLANKGSNEVKSGADWVPLKTGASLKLGDELKLSDNAYIGLVHTTGQPLEVKKAGSYKVDVLASQVKPSSGVLNKYTEFILSSNTTEAKKNRLSATGAVDRGENYAIRLNLPPNHLANFYNNVEVVSWNGDGITGPYTVTLLNMFDDELTKVETSETSLQIDLSDSRFAHENAIQVEVKSSSNAKVLSKRHVIKRMTPADQAAVKKSLGEINGNVSEETALNKFILAGFYEKQSLLIDAATAYEQAIKLAPDVVAYKEAYQEFLERNGIK